MANEKEIADILKELRIIRNLLVSSLVVSGVEATTIATKILDYSDVSTLSRELPLAELKKAVATVKLSNNDQSGASHARRRRGRGR